MDTNDFLSTLLSEDCLKSIGKAAGADQKDVQNVLTTALPTLLTGALGQAQDEKTAEGFAGALADHAKVDAEDLNSFMSNVDMLDGGKILTHLLGGNATAVAEETATRSGLGLGKTIKILAIAAPLLMTLLGKHNQQNQTQQNATSLSPVVSLLGGLLGGGQQQQQTSLLGSLLGASQPQQQQTSLLGSLLGASQPQQQQTSLLGSLLGASQPQQQQTSLGGDLLSSLLGGGQQQQQQQTSLGGDLLSSLLGGGQTTQQQTNLGGDLLSSLLGGGQTTQTTTTTTTTGKKKKKPANSAASEVLPLENATSNNQNQQSGSLMDILMGLLK